MTKPFASQLEVCLSKASQLFATPRFSQLQTIADGSLLIHLHLTSFVSVTLPNPLPHLFYFTFRSSGSPCGNSSTNACGSDTPQSCPTCLVNDSMALYLPALLWM